ncbi:MAG: LEA type 2 family protein [Paludibacteraceae bacterium]|nr:LEA type 2 family protein [Paludibacteraceae bacterium]
MRNIKSALLLVAMLVALTGCSFLSGIVNMTKCEYSYKSVSDVKVGGIDFSNLSAVSLMQNMSTISKLLQGDFKDLPLELTVNLNVKNPNEGKAAINGMIYTMNIDGLDVAEGNLRKSFSVEGGKTATLPLVVRTNLGNILDKQNRSTVVEIVKNFVGISGNKSKIKMKLSPTITGRNNEQRKLMTVPVSFEYGGKKK